MTHHIQQCQMHFVYRHGDIIILMVVVVVMMIRIGIIHVIVVVVTNIRGCQYGMIVIFIDTTIIINIIMIVIEFIPSCCI